LCRPERDSRGSVTAETALALPTVMLLLAVLLGAAHVALDQLRCVDAARAAARLAARGEPADQVVAQAVQLAPPQSRVEVHLDPETVSVRVTGSVRLVWGATLPTGWTAVGRRELP
jgi:TadE-like protein